MRRALDTLYRAALWGSALCLVAIALLVGLFYTLPNFFPEVPAVQVSSSKATFGSQTERSLCASVQVPGHPISVFGSEQKASTD